MSRALTLSLKIGGVLRSHDAVTNLYAESWERYTSVMGSYRLKEALELAFEYATAINKYVDDMTPWKLNVDEPQERESLEHILYTLVFHLRRVGILLIPFFEEKMREMLSRIGAPYDDAETLEAHWHKHIAQFTITEKGNPLYARISVE